MRARRLVGAAVLATLVMIGCGAQTDEPRDAGPTASATGSAEPDTVPAEAKALLARFGLDGLAAAEIVDRLDRLGGADRPAELTASVRPAELVVSSGGEEFTLPLPDDRFYLSVAPYVDQTHECFFHSLTTCKGELGDRQVRVRVVDETNDEVLVDETRTTFDNGFVGFWLPRDIEGAVQVTYDGQVGNVDFATGEDAPTCVTTLRLTQQS